MGLRKEIVLTESAQRSAERLSCIRQSEWSHTLEQVSRHPWLGKVVLEGAPAVRRLILRKSDVLLYYAVTSTHIVILAVCHGRTGMRPFEDD